MKTATIGIDLGGTNIKGGLVDASGALSERRSIPTEASGGFVHVFARLIGLVRALQEQARLAGVACARLGIGVPGPMRHADGFIYAAPNLPGWVNIPLRDRLQDALSLPVNVENDANAAAFGEFTAGAGRGASDMVMLTLGTGIGGGVIVRGRLHRGHFDSAGEIGHMIVVAQGRECPCGQRGCLERYASANAVVERVKDAVAAGESSTLAARLRARESIDAPMVAAAARDGDPCAARIWDDACRYLAVACVNLQHVLNPRRIVLTGGLINAGEQLFAAVREHFARASWTVAQDRPEIVAATLDGDAGVIGAAVLAGCAADTMM